jgi:predicted TIM-barrel fold metal-dependent hydrolase
MIIDARTYVGEAEPQIADPPLELDGHSPERILSLMEKADIDKSIIIPRHCSDFNKANEKVAKIVETYPDKFIGFGRVNPNCTECAFDAARNAIKNLGLKGLEVSYFAWKWYDPVIAVPLFRRLFELDAPILIRADIDKGLVRYSLDQIATLSFRRPIIVAVSWDMCAGFTMPPYRDELLEIAQSNDNIFIETSGNEVMILERLVSKIGVHRLIFGSNSPPREPISEKAKIEAMRITEDEKKLILGENILRILEGRWR